MDEDGKGEIVQALVERPVLDPDLAWIFEAYITIKEYSAADGIKVGDVLAYCELLYIDDYYERKRLIRFVKYLENITVKFYKERQPKQAKGKIPKKGRLKAR